MTARLDWARDGRDWPHREASRFVDAAGLRWHVQRMGTPGDARVLLVHGTGASTHSWAALMPLLIDHAEVLAVDLPGHGFSALPPGGDLSLPAMAEALSALLKVLDWTPTLAIGHSAGAAILVRMALDGRLKAPLVAVNGAFLAFGGPAAPLLSPLTRLLYASRWVPKLFARRAAAPGVVERLIRGTGSTLDADGTEHYRRLMRSSAHAEAALGMMAHWDLRSLPHELPRLPVPLHLFVGSGDRAVPPRQGRQVVARCPRATLTLLPGLGHLAHEENPAAVAAALQAKGLLP
jgi:magnesium chelatase accessory protein